jgi:hypothetical protein
MELTHVSKPGGGKIRGLSKDVEYNRASSAAGPPLSPLSMLNVLLFEGIIIFVAAQASAPVSGFGQARMLGTNGLSFCIWSFIAVNGRRIEENSFESCELFPDRTDLARGSGAAAPNAAIPEFIIMQAVIRKLRTLFI